MSFQYALQFLDKSILGQNSDIPGSVKIELINSFPSMIVSENSNHGGIISGSTIAQGDFCLEFTILYSGENEAKTTLTELACRNETRQFQELKVTCYTMAQRTPVIDYEVKFYAPKILISRMDNKSAKENNIFKIISNPSCAAMEHLEYKLDDSATKLLSSPYRMNFLRVDMNGLSIIDNRDI